MQFRTRMLPPTGQGFEVLYASSSQRVCTIDSCTQLHLCLSQQGQGRSHLAGCFAKFAMVLALRLLGWDGEELNVVAALPPELQAVLEHLEARREYDQIHHKVTIDSSRKPLS